MPSKKSKKKAVNTETPPPSSSPTPPPSSSDTKSSVEKLKKETDSILRSAVSCWGEKKIASILSPVLDRKFAHFLETGKVDVKSVRVQLKRMRLIAGDADQTMKALDDFISKFE